MRLIGMLDSPYVRRVAISMKVMGIAYEHEPLSVFRDYEAFAAINPAVKAPTLVTDTGVVLMDSTLILDQLERLLPAERWFQPQAPADHARSQRLTGLALAACEKSVQLVYEFNLRPPERRHEPWIARVRGQLAATYRALEAEMQERDEPALTEHPSIADITIAVAWHFSRTKLPDELAAEQHPRLQRFSERAEETSVFRAAPMG